MRRKTNCGPILAMHMAGRLGEQRHASNLANIINGQGHLLSYDLNGNRVEDQSWGTQVTPSYTYDESSNLPVMSGYTSQTGLQTQWYVYDSMNRLSTVSTGAFDEVQTGTDGSGNPVYTMENLGKSHAILLDKRMYDGASRVVESGPAVGSLPAAYVSALVGTNADLSGATNTISQYDRSGRVLSQHVVNLASSAQNSDTAYTSYDAAGNLQAYTSTSNGITTVTTITQQYLESYVQSVVSSTSTNNSSGHKTTGNTTDHYDANGLLTSVSAIVNGAEDVANEKTMVNDAGGHVLTKVQQGNTLNESVINGTVAGVYGYGTDPAKPFKSDGTPNYQVQGNFDLSYEPVTNGYPAAATGQYAVRAGDTLQGIAQAAYGDSSLWYLIANANGLSGNQDLRVGAVLNLPTKVGSVHNGSGTYAPYDPSKIVGSTNPNLPTPSGNSHSGSGGLGTIIMIVVAVVATVFTAGAASILMAGGSLGTAGLGGIMAAGGAALTGTAAVGVGVATSTGLAAVGAAAIGGAVGSIVSQGVGDAIGASSGFNWSQVAEGALGSAVGAGVGEAAPGLAAASQGVGPSSWAAAAATSAIGNAATQEISVQLGLQKNFSWVGVAAAAAGAAVGSAVSEGLSTTVELQGPTLDGSPLLARGNSVFGGFGQYTGNALRAGISGTATGLTTAVIANHGTVNVEQVAADAFGNALGNGLKDAAISNSYASVAAQANTDAQEQAFRRSEINDMNASSGGFASEQDAAQLPLVSGMDLESDHAYYNRVTRQALSQSTGGISDSATDAEILAYRMQLAGYGPSWSLKQVGWPTVSGGNVVTVETGQQLTPLRRGEIQISITTSIATTSP